MVLAEFSPLPALAFGMLGSLVVVLGLALGVLPVNERTMFTAVMVVVSLVVAVTLLCIASAEAGPDECVFGSE